VRDHRSRRSECSDVDGHDDALAGAHLAAFQADAVRARGRVDARHGHVGVEFLLLNSLLETMSPETVMTIGSRALEVTLTLAAPLLLVALITGLIVGAFQAATQINEQTLSFIPKLLAMALALVIAGPWMLKVLISYTRELFESIPSLIN